MAEWRTERMEEWSNGGNGYIRTIYGRHTHTDDTDVVVRRNDRNCGGMSEWRKCGMAEMRNGGMAEWWNGGMAEWQTEWWNGGMAKWQTE